MRRRRARRTPELTPLIDVLFILLFASLIQARGTVESSDPVAQAAPDAGAGADADAGVAADAAPDAAPVDAATPMDDEPLARARELAESVALGDVFMVEIAARRITAMGRWRDGVEVRRERTDYRLLRPLLPGDSDEELDYVGRSAPDERLCRRVRRHFAVADSELIVVLVATDEPIDEWPLALSSGLGSDMDICRAENSAVILIRPGDRLDDIH